ncbi:AAA family ATPase [Aquabacterium sp.]|uniref:ATP-binding protein n=1 Tax=Aquabacterium sp. TaxID=1872578 RepID=UPI003783C46E
MRLQQLSLIRYGRFTDQVLDFPRRDCDFHLVVGANEAGKSTLRRAVSELLFGMALRSEMAFLHPVSELRLGAVVESAAGSLAFHRSRSRKSLRRPDDEALPDTALAAHLGDTGEALFNRMFCLDLAGLLAGGQTILEASDDVGQLLFQSAAGLSSLGSVRDALAEEANRLYAPRKSGDRLFYQALERHEAARQALRAATVHTRSWSAATAQLASVQAARQAASEQYRSLSAARQQLERIRRIAPRVAQLRDAQAQLQALAGTVAFPEDAARRLADGEVALATQGTARALHRERTQDLQARLDALAVDDAILTLDTAVEALAAAGQACLNHPRDIAHAEQDVQARLRDAAARAQQLGWPTDEAALRARLPTPLALKTLLALLQQRGALAQGQQSAQDSLDRAQAALDRLQRQQAGPAAAPLSPALAAALQDAQPFKASATRQRALEATLGEARGRLAAALSALSTWHMEPAALAALAVPAEEELAALKDARATLAAGLDAARQQQAQAQEQARQSALALAQFSASHSVVTLPEVLQARAARDAWWDRIKTQQEPLATGAPRLDQAIAEADRLVDRQRDHAEAAARLDSLRQAQDRDAAAAQARQQQQDDAAAALAAFDARWAARMAAAGLPGMALLGLSGWLADRRAALEAAAQLDSHTQALAAEQQAEQAAATALRAALQASGSAPEEGSRLAALCAQAEQLLDAERNARAGAEMQARQRSDAEAECHHQQQLLQSRSTALAQWQARWQQAAAAAALDGGVITPDAAGPAIELAGQVIDLLGQVDTWRQQRIGTMQRDLAELHAAAQALRAALGLPDDDGQDPFALAGALLQRLQRAREARQERQRLTAEREASAAALRSAEATLAATQATLDGLYQLARSDDAAVVRAQIADCDRRRMLHEQEQQHRQAIVDAGDGLALEALLAECDAVSPATLPAQLEALDAQLATVVDQRARLAGEEAQAQAELDRMRGGADAAVAESKRLEALAQLGDAAERYVTVATAARLLRWAIDRYRERKQGPLLQRAGALFAQLTLGSFSRLVPDFEVTPPRLIALRPSGERVDIGGLSEGTRDQLFLALRLAALEMHIAADRPLPFIADDLFVNFHDSRSRAGLAALGELARKTQVIFLTHHAHLVDVARQCIDPQLHVIELGGP